MRWIGSILNNFGSDSWNLSNYESRSGSMKLNDYGSDRIRSTGSLVPELALGRVGGGGAGLEGGGQAGDGEAGQGPPSRI